MTTQEYKRPNRKRIRESDCSILTASVVSGGLTRLFAMCIHTFRVAYSYTRS
jgi:hypothetical protein